MPETVFDDEDWIVLRRVDGPAVAVHAGRGRGAHGARCAAGSVRPGRARDPLGAPRGRRDQPPAAPRLRPAAVRRRRVGGRHDPRASRWCCRARTTGEERRAVYQALGSSNARRCKLDGRPARRYRRRGHAAPARFTSAEVEPCWLERVDGGASQATLRAHRRGARLPRRWASATPVALDRNPGDLRARDPRKEAAAYAEAEETIARGVHVDRPRRARRG